MTRSNKGDWDQLVTDYPEIERTLVDQVRCGQVASILVSDIPDAYEARHLNKRDHLDTRPDVFVRNGLYSLPGGKKNISVTSVDTYARVDICPNQPLISYDIDGYNQRAQASLGMMPFPFSNESDLVEFAMEEIFPLIFEERFHTRPVGRRYVSYTTRVGGADGFDHVIDNLQIEIDGIGESDTRCLVVEAKMTPCDNLTLRQIHPAVAYYEQRKKERPNAGHKEIAFFVVTQAVDGIIITEMLVGGVSDFSARSSRVWHVVCQGRETEKTFRNVALKAVKETVPLEDVPQANSLDGLGQFLLLASNVENRHDLATRMDVGIREVDYRRQAATALGLVAKGRDGKLVSTPLGNSVRSVLCPRRRVRLLTRLLSVHPGFDKIFRTRTPLDKQEIHLCLEQSMPVAWSRIGGTTRVRRVQCVAAWLRQVHKERDERQRYLEDDEMVLL